MSCCLRVPDGPQIQLPYVELLCEEIVGQSVFTQEMNLTCTEDTEFVPGNFFFSSQVFGHGCEVLCSFNHSPVEDPNRFQSMQSTELQTVSEPLPLVHLVGNVDEMQLLPQQLIVRSSLDTRSTPHNLGMSGTNCGHSDITRIEQDQSLSESKTSCVADFTSDCEKVKSCSAYSLST